MIVRMKEILLFTSAQDVTDTIQSLGEIGVMDIKEVQKPSSETMQRCLESLKEAQEAIAILEQHKAKEAKEPIHSDKVDAKDPKRMVQRVLKTQQLEKNLRQTLEQLRTQLEFYNTWGHNFNKQDIAYLRQNGIYLRLYRIDISLKRIIPKEATVEELPEKDGKLPIAFFSQNPKDKLVFKEEDLPELSFNDATEVHERKQRQLNQLEEFLSAQKGFLSAIQDYEDVLIDRVNAEKALDSMGQIEGKVKYLKGFVPKDHVQEFKTLAHQQKWGFSISEPTDIDEVPVYIKNPKWISIINPMMKFIDIVPGYKEVDVSIYFLIAFALFFAMLVGDAGYGLIFLILTILFWKKMAPQLRTLILVLSGSTIIWGVLSGTYFGAEQIAKLPFLKEMIVPNIASFGVDNINFMMHLSFLIGAIHLTVAHGIRVFQFINSIKALSEVGWISLVWGLFFVTEELVLGNPAPSWYMWLFIVGATLVILFSKESTSFFKSMGASIANLPLSLISGFSDIVSYVRLFAVGMATAAVAASFNNMALPDGIAGMGFLDLIMAAVALLLGHTLNIALALMAVMVHGIRLNMLEFAGHLGVQFSGEAYKPFKLKTEDRHI